MQSFDEDRNGDPAAKFGGSRLVPLAVPPLSATMPPVQKDIEDESVKKKKKKKKNKKKKDKHNDKFRNAAVGVTAARAFEDGIQTGTAGTYRRLDEQLDPFGGVYPNFNPQNPPLQHASHQKKGAMPNGNVGMSQISNSSMRSSGGVPVMPFVNYQSGYVQPVSLSQSVRSNMPLHDGYAQVVPENFSQSFNSQANPIMPPIPSLPPVRRRTPSASLLSIPENEVYTQGVSPGYGLRSPQASFRRPPGVIPFAQSYTAGSFRHPGPQMCDAPSASSFDSRAAWRRAGNVTSIVVQPSVAKGRSTLEIASLDEPGIVEIINLD